MLVIVVQFKSLIFFSSSLCYRSAGESLHCRPTYYTAVHELKDSDHRPVVAGFEMLMHPSTCLM
jgi:hypothetical protein